MRDSAAEAILASLPKLDEHQVRLLHGMWQGGDAGARARGWQRAKRALAARGETRLLDEAQSAVSRWVRDYAGGTLAHPYDLDQSFRDSGRLDGRIAAAPAILDAIVATLAGDAIDPDDHAELLGPWTIATTHPAPDDPAWHDLAPGDDT
ncbi:MAG: hypothetical protein KF809_14780 [Chloroflexi bacterium]|nr:hypothetical protein [Chloroflexota bacterium]